MHGLCPNDFTMIGGGTNCGKSRFLMNVLSYLVCHENQKVCLLSNEMTEDDFYKSLICSIVNMPDIQDLHGKKLRLEQSEIVQSRFVDNNGCLMERQQNESVEEFESRLLSESSIYRDYSAVLQWFQENYHDSFYFVNVSDNYSIERLKAEIRKAKRLGCKVIAYDTLKSYQSSEWGDFVQTATGLSECIKSDPDGLHGIATFQLTDDAAQCAPKDLGSNKIANAKHIMHVADNMIMFMHLDNQQANSYLIKDSSGAENAIVQSIKIAAFKIVKNRRGGGKDTLYAVQNNLHLNFWKEVGMLIPNKKTLR